MSLEILSADKVQIKEQVDNWEQGIALAAQPLLNQDYFEQSYITSMIDSVKKLGPYIVIAPEIAIAHARPNDEVNKIERQRERERERFGYTKQTEEEVYCYLE